MKRPSDQVKLLFLGLLRTVSALAARGSSASTNHVGYHAQSHHQYHHSPFSFPRWTKASVGSFSSSLSLHPSSNAAFPGSYASSSSSSSSSSWTPNHESHQQQQQQQRPEPPPQQSWHYGNLWNFQQAPPGVIPVSSPSSSPPRIVSPTSQQYPPQQQQHQQQHDDDHKDDPFMRMPPLELRVARRTDVPSLQRCNLATLPENYNSAFYWHHISQWPDLALVVVVAATNQSRHDHHHQHQHQQQRDDRHSSVARPHSFSSFPVRNPMPGTILIEDPSQQQQQVVAYVLGKVEERRHYLVPNENDHDPDDQDHWFTSTTRNSMATATYRTEWIGHVTSLAVLEPYRRQGLAGALMDQLHYHIQTNHPAVDRVGLHVRHSNQAAVELYRRFGYDQAENISGYYQDGEDAYYMLKTIRRQSQRQQQQQMQVKQQWQQKQESNNNEQLPRHNHGFFSGWRKPIQQQPNYHQQHKSTMTSPLTGSNCDSHSHDEAVQWTLPRPVGLAAQQQHRQQQQHQQQRRRNRGSEQIEEEGEESPELMSGSF